jgi:hypothetical protein
MMHLTAQVRTVNGLRGIFKLSEILGSPSYSVMLMQADCELCFEQLWKGTIYHVFKVAEGKGGLT